MIYPISSIAFGVILVSAYVLRTLPPIVGIAFLTGILLSDYSTSFPLVCPLSYSIAAVAFFSTRRKDPHEDPFFRNLGVAVRIIIAAFVAAGLEALLYTGGALLNGHISLDGMRMCFIQRIISDLSGGLIGLAFTFLLLHADPQESDRRAYRYIAFAIAAFTCLFIGLISAFGKFQLFLFSILGLELLLSLVGSRRILTISAITAVIAGFISCRTDIEFESFNLFLCVLALGVLLLPALEISNYRTLRNSSFVLLFSILITTSVHFLLRAYARAEDVSHMQRLTTAVQDHVLDKFRLYSSALYGSVGLFDASQDVEPDEWTAYVHSLRLEENYVGLLGLGVLRPVPSSQLKSYTEERQRINPNFKISTVAGTEDKPVEEHIILESIEPDGKVRSNIGRDFSSDPNRSGAANKARDTGTLSTTTILPNFADGSFGPGMVIFLPRYKGGSIPSTLADRRAQLELWITTRLDTLKLFTDARSPNESEIEFQVYNEDRSKDAYPLYRSREDLPDEADMVTTVSILDQQFQFFWFKNASFVYSSQRPAAWMAFLTILSGLVLTVVIAHSMKMQRHAAALSDQSDAMLAATQAKSRFLAYMSHEIRTPLNSIYGFVAALSDPNLSLADRKSAMQSIAVSSKHLDTVINDILDFSRIEAGKISIEKISISLFDLCSDIIRMTKHGATEKGLEFSLSYTYPLPEIIKTDPTRFKQALCNLIQNAIKFTKHGFIKVQLAFNPTTKFLTIVVKDSGVGIPKDKITTIFELYTQAEASTNREFGGSGLGLAIAKEIVTLLGGSISIQSQEHRGTQFTINLPLESCGELVSDVPADTILVDGQLQIEPRFHGTVLIAEDGSENWQYLSYILKRFGVSYEVVEDGGEVLKAVQSKDFDLIFMDLHMPNLSGYDASRLLRQHGFLKPVVAVSADVIKENIDLAKSAGCTDFIGKPFTPDDIYRVLSTFLQSPATPAPPAIERRVPSTTIQLLKDMPELGATADHFFSHLKFRMDDMEEAFLNARWKDLARLAHALKGAAANMRSENIRKDAADLEQAAKTENQDEAARALSTLENTLENAAAWWKEHNKFQSL